MMEIYLMLIDAEDIIFLSLIHLIEFTYFIKYRQVYFARISKIYFHCIIVAFIAAS